SLPVEKRVEPVASGLGSCVLMGTIVREGSGRGVVVRTGAHTDFGRIAAGLSEHHAETAFQAGLRDFSYLLVRVAGALTVSIFVINVALHRPLIEALLFSLAIAIGLTPQLLPAIVTVSLSTGSRRLAQRNVLVKRLVSIEDLGNITLLFTDKTGTLTDGRITFDRSVDGVGSASESASVHGLVCTEAVLGAREVVSGNQLDVSLWQGAGDAATAAAREWTRIASRPFDHTRRWASVLAEDPQGSR